MESQIFDNDVQDDEVNTIEIKLGSKRREISAKKSLSSFTETDNAVEEFEKFVESLLSDKGSPFDEVQTEINNDILENTQLQKLLHKSAKLKTIKATKSVSIDLLVRLLAVLQNNITNTANEIQFVKPEGVSNAECKDVGVTQNIMNAVFASVTALNIMTSDDMPFLIYQEENIDKIITLTEELLKKYIYPFCGQINGVSKKGKEVIVMTNVKRSSLFKKLATKHNFVSLFNRVIQIVSLLSELLKVHRLTDCAILHITNIAITPFGVENLNELQSVAIKLAANTFVRYKKHQTLLINAVLDSINNMPRYNKAAIKLFHVNSSDNIQMTSALILQIVQSSVLLIEDISGNETSLKEKEVKQYNYLKLLIKSNTVINATVYFVKEFIEKYMGKKNGDNRLLVENIIQDFLTVLFVPEWPVAELFIKIMGHFLIQKFQNKSIDISVRNSILNIISLIACKLRKEILHLESNSKTILQILQEKKQETFISLEKKKINKRRKIISKYANDFPENNDAILQTYLLAYLKEKEENDDIFTSAQHFYIIMWYKEAQSNVSSLDNETRNTPKNKKIHEKSNKLKMKMNKKCLKSIHKESNNAASENPSSFMKSHLQLLISKINNKHDKERISRELPRNIDKETAHLISRYFAIKSPLCQSFQIYLKHILCALTENQCSIRTKAMKSLTLIIEIDPSLLERSDVHKGVCYSFFDRSVPVREAALDLLGRYILLQKDLLNQYYDVLTSRILDTSISVRKRIINIFHNFCTKYPDNPKVPDICSKLIQRIKDQENIKKLVVNVFKELWFNPLDNKCPSDLVNTVSVITKVVAKLNEKDITYFEDLLTTLFDSKGNSLMIEDRKEKKPSIFWEKCKEITNYLIQHTLKAEEGVLGSGDQELDSSRLLLACIYTLQCFAKSCPSLLVEHIGTLQPYLNLKCSTYGDLQIVRNVAQTLTYVMPLVQYSGENFLAQLEDNLVKLILTCHQTVIEYCVSCLSVVIHKFTKNFKLVNELFERYLKHLTESKSLYEKNPSHSVLVKCHPYTLRCLFTIGILCRHFSFAEKYKETLNNVQEEVFTILIYFLHQNKDMQMISLKAIGSLCLRYRKLMLRYELKNVLIKILTSDDDLPCLKKQVIDNLLVFLREEESCMMLQDHLENKTKLCRDLKKIGNKSSEIASEVIQLYITSILQLCLHSSEDIRLSVLNLIQLVIYQGLIQPYSIIPCLICLATDETTTVKTISESLLLKTETNYPGTINMKSLQGFELSYNFQKVFQSKDASAAQTVRGFRSNGKEIPTALNGFLYHLIQNSVKSRRALVSNLLKYCEKSSENAISLFLYIADNLAYFPFSLLDEPLYVIHQIDINILACGNIVIEHFLEISSEEERSKCCTVNENGVLYLSLPNINDKERNYLQIPKDPQVLQKCIVAMENCILLVDLQHHLKSTYSITEDMLIDYCPDRKQKVADKAIRMNASGIFTPKVIGKKTEIKCNDLEDDDKRTLVETYIVFKEIFDVC